MANCTIDIKIRRTVWGNAIIFLIKIKQLWLLRLVKNKPMLECDIRGKKTKFCKLAEYLYI